MYENFRRMDSEDFRPMDREEYRAAIAKLGLSQLAAARLLHLADRTSRAYALGESEVPFVIAMLLRAMIKYRISAEQLVELNRPAKSRASRKAI